MELSDEFAIGIFQINRSNSTIPDVYLISVARNGVNVTVTFKYLKVAAMRIDGLGIGGSHVQKGALRRQQKRQVFSCQSIF